MTPPSSTGPGPAPGPALHVLMRHASGLLGQVRRGVSLNEALPRVPAALRPGSQALAFHTLRWRGSAQAARRILAERAPPPAVDDLLTCALALLWPQPEPPYAEHTVVDEAVQCARTLAPRSAGFVNAVLRRFLRERTAVVEQATGQDEARWNHPAWWIRRLQQDWPQQAQALMQAAQEHPPMTLRRARSAPEWPGADSGLSGRPAAIPQAAVMGVVASASPRPGLSAPAPLSAPDGYCLDRPRPVTAIPGFARGACTVQDAAAQLAAPLLLQGLQPCAGQPLRVLDACCAPGGKTAHLLDLLRHGSAVAGQSPLEPGSAAQVLALDVDPRRLERVHDTLTRLRLGAPGPQGVTQGAAEDAPQDDNRSAPRGDSQAGRPVTVSVVLRAADAGAVSTWWDGRPFDAILLDAPCSGSGIVRRHPDARWLKRETDIAALARTQAALLDALWPLVRPGGRLLYATCSVFRAEGCEQIDAFLQRHGLPRSVIDPLSPGHLLPLADNPQEATGAGAAPACDGFYYALLHKP